MPRKPKAKTLSIGTHVTLVPFEDQPLQTGIVLTYFNGCYVVQLDRKYRGRNDDGLRDVPEDQIKETGK